MTQSKPDRILLGQFGAAHGLKGEVRLKTYTGDPFAIGDYGPLTTDDGRSFEITHLRDAKEVLIARVKGVADRTAAEKLTNLKLYVDRSVLGDVEDEDEFFHADLVGLIVETEAGERLGSVAAIYNFGAGDVVEIKPVAGGKLVLLPFTKAAVPVVDIKGGRLVADQVAYDLARAEAKPDQE
ncbi:MAG: ribosome maturation factor RimM [Beijerinckiaceae bacterium]|nr:ribosome maturation factor RimM [Beijerinckiaceae bacterium]